MNEIKETFFQIVPRKKAGWSLDWVHNRVQFMNDCFNLDEVFMIEAVKMEGNMHYTFKIIFDNKHELEYSFPRKEQALKAQRELARAYTQTKEFKLDEDTSTAFER